MGHEADATREAEEALGGERRKTELAIDHGGGAIDVHRQRPALGRGERRFERDAGACKLTRDLARAHRLVNEPQERRPAWIHDLVQLVAETR